jgi:Zn-dependent peptidase ImmA (M78 family)
MAIAAKKQRPNLNPRILKWAREWRGCSLEDAARRVSKRPEDVAAWESSREDGPTVRQARVLADLYERSFLEFFLPDPPPLKEPELVADFRVHRDASNPKETRQLIAIQGWAEAQRQNALDLFESIGEHPPIIPDELFVVDPPDKADFDDAAEKARRITKFSMIDQFGLPSSKHYQLPNIIRAKLESVGILTLRHSGLSEFDARGICIFASPLPIIVFGNESPGAQSFTLAHELGHVVLKKSGISGKRTKNDPSIIEKWCDHFASSFLMPRIEIRAALGQYPLNPPLDEISDHHLQELARRFRVSQHAMLVRLVYLGYVNPTYYWGVKKPLFDAQESKYKSHGRSKYYGSRFRSSLGNLYTGLVLNAWNSGRITNHNACEYMGIKNFEHLFAIRDNFDGS